MKKGKLWLFGIAALMALAMVTGCAMEAPSDPEVQLDAQGVSVRSVALVNALPSSLNGTNWDGYGPQDPPEDGEKITLAFAGSGSGVETGTASFYFPHDNTYPIYAYTYYATTQTGIITEMDPEIGRGNPGEFSIVEYEGNYSLLFINFYGYHPDDIVEFQLVE
jgi:hypothetical protein